VVDFVREFSAQTELAVTRVVGWLGIARGKFFDWRQRYGHANEHNALVPRGQSEGEVSSGLEPSHPHQPFT
jgi:putative transposase